MFKELSKEKISVNEEKKMQHFLDSHILQKSIDKRDKYFVFYDNNSKVYFGGF